jgi:hypothetical protein
LEFHDIWNYPSFFQPGSAPIPSKQMNQTCIRFYQFQETEKMTISTRIVRTLFGLLITFGSVNSAIAQQPVAEETDQEILYLIDRSGSIELADPPHNQEAVVNHAIDMSRLTEGRVKLAFLFFNSDQVEVVAGPDGLPAAGSAEMRERCRQVLSQPCHGGTPLDEALQVATRILADSPSKRKTIVLISDGDPATHLRPDLFGEVKDAIAAEEARLEADGGRQAIETYQAKLRDGQSTEYLALQQIQQPLLFARCLQLSERINNLDVRVVSFAFATGLESLREIHIACGGADSDYVELVPGSTLEQMHAIQLFDGILAFPIIDVPASDQFETSQEFPLGRELEARSLTVVEFNAVPDLEKHAQFTIDIDGRSYAWAGDSIDDALVISRDNKQRLTTIAVIEEPAGKGTFIYTSPNSDVAFPGARIYRYIASPTHLRFVCHPADISASETTGFQVNEHSDQPWLCGMQWSDDRTIPLENADVVFRNRNTNRDYLVTIHRDRQFQNRFQIDPPPKFAVGSYDVVLHFQLQSGLTFSTRIEKHFEVIGVEEIVLLEISTDSNAIDAIDFGEIGDDVLARTISVKAHSATPHDLDLRIRIVGLCDKNGTVTGSDWITVNDPTVRLPHGESVSLKFDLKIPQRDIPDELIDGLLTARLEIVNAETLQPVTIGPLVDGTGDEDSLSLIRITLRRPRFFVSFPYARREWLKAGNSGLRAATLANVATPFSRWVPIRIRTDSKIDRDVAVRLSSLRTTGGSAQSKIDLLPDDDWVGQKTIPAGSTVTYWARFRLDELTPDDEQQAVGKIVVSGSGMQPVVIDITAGLGRSWGQAIRVFLWVLASLFVTIVVRSTARHRKACRFSPRRISTRFRPGRPVFDLFKFHPGDDQLVITPTTTGLAIQDEDGDFVPQSSPVAIELATRNLRLNSGQQFEVEIERIENGGKLLLARVVRATAYDRIRRRTRRVRRIAFILAASSIALVLLMYRFEPATRLVQYCLDLFRLT